MVEFWNKWKDFGVGLLRASAVTVSVDLFMLSWAICG